MSDPSGAVRSLIVVCGVPRSGTSVVGALCNTSPSVEILNEIPSLSRFPALAELLEEYDRWVERTQINEGWKRLSPDLHAHRREGIVLNLARATAPHVPGELRHSRWDRRDHPRATTPCFKCPGAEHDMPLFEELFPVTRPTYLYCFREPRAVYESILSVPWGSEYSPEGYLDLLRRSFTVVLAQDSQRPGSVVLLDARRLSSDRRLRTKLFSELFRRLGLRRNWASRRFLATWPPVNRRAMHFGDTEFLDPAEKSSRLERFDALFPDDVAAELLAEVRRRAQGQTEHAGGGMVG